MPSPMVPVRGGMLVKARTVSRGSVRMAHTSRMMPRRATKSCKQRSGRPQRLARPVAVTGHGVHMAVLTMRHPATVVKTSPQM